MEEKKQHFVLVHGGGHGAWCWWKLVPLLEQSGHRVTAIDLASGGDTASEISADDIETFEQYNRPLQQLFKTLPQGEKVILVGHSMGGINVSYMTENYSNQIAVSVYVAAFMLPSDMGTLEAGVLLIPRCSVGIVLRCVQAAVTWSRQTCNSVELAWRRLPATAWRYSAGLQFSSAGFTLVIILSCDGGSRRRGSNLINKLHFRNCSSMDSSLHPWKCDCCKYLVNAVYNTFCPVNGRSLFCSIDSRGRVLPVIAQIKNNRHDKHLGIILHSKRGPDHPPTSYCFTRQALQERVYSLCSPEDLEVAAEKVRPGPMSYQVVSGRLHHSADRYGTVPRVFIMCEKDLVIRLPSAERMVKLNPPKEVIRLPHADHMPFVSVTQDLHYHLANIAQRY